MGKTGLWAILIYMKRHIYEHRNHAKSKHNLMHHKTHIYCIFHSLCCSVSCSPAVLAWYSILQVFSSHNYSLVSKHWFLLIYFADHGFSILYYSLLLDLSWPMFLFWALYFVLLLLFFFVSSPSHTNSYLPLLFLCVVFSLFISSLLSFHFLYFSYFSTCFLLSVTCLYISGSKGKYWILKKWWDFLSLCNHFQNGFKSIKPN